MKSLLVGLRQFVLLFLFSFFFFFWQLSSSVYKQLKVSMTCQVSVEVLLALKPKNYYYNNIAIQLKLLCTYTPKVYDNAGVERRDGFDSENVTN